MFKQLFVLIILAGIIYGLYYLFMLFPEESTIIIGIILILLIGNYISRELKK